MSHQHHSASPHQRQLLRRRARRMRHSPTESEWLLWLAVRQRKLGVAFRRQVVLQGYIADFYACSARLVVEIDGGWHDQRRGRDAHRTHVLRAAGYRIVRVTADEVVHARPEVIAKIRSALAAPARA